MVTRLHSVRVGELMRDIVRESVRRWPFWIALAVAYVLLGILANHAGHVGPLTNQVRSIGTQFLCMLLPGYWGGRAYSRRGHDR